MNNKEGVQKTVWVVQEGKNDYAAAEQHGVVKFITKEELVSVGEEQNRMVAQDVRRFKSEYIPGVDFLVPSGNPMISALVAMSLPPGKHKWLKWDGRRSVYSKFTIEGL